MIPAYALDLYPRADPRDGSLIRTLAPQKASWRGEANGTGSGLVEVRATSDDGEAFDPRGMDYIRVRRTTDDAIVGGFFTDKAKIKLLDKDSTKLLRVEGAGTLSYLARSVMAPHTYIHGVFTGQDPISGVWNLAAQSTVFANGSFLGAMLWRVIYEAQHFQAGAYTHRHEDGLEYTDTHADDRVAADVGIPDLVLGFDQFEDSDGNAWTLDAGEFKAQVNDSVLSVVKRLMEAGLYVELDPHTFELRAWEGTDHRRDRTGVAWGSSVVRLQAPTAEDQATGNILSDADRQVDAHIKRRTLWVGSGGTYRKITGSTDIPWEGGVNADLETDDALDQLGSAQIQGRTDAGDTLKLRLKPGDDPTEGGYIAWDHIRLDDLVTVHTGTDQWEHDDQAFPVAALTVNLRQGGDWETWVELGASFASADRSFKVAPIPSHNHLPNPPLCPMHIDPAITCENAHVVGTPKSLTNPGLESGTTNWRVSTDPGAGRTNTQAHSGSWSCEDTNPHRWYWIPGFNALAGKRYVLKFWHRADSASVAGGGDQQSFTFGTGADSHGAADATDGVLEQPTWGLEEVGVWVQRCATWEPSADRTNVKVDWHLDGFLDDVEVWEGDIEDVSDAAIVGSSRYAARCDHNHNAEDLLGAIVLSDDTPLVESGSGSPGTSEEVSRSDHVHPDGGDGGESEPGGLGVLQLTIPLIHVVGGVTYNVNNAAYAAAAFLLSRTDFDITPWTHFGIYAWAQSNAVGQTITLQGIHGVLAGTLSAAGNDLVVTNTFGFFSTGWIAISPTLTGLQHVGVAAKGSNATVDLTVQALGLILKYDP